MDSTDTEFQERWPGYNDQSWPERFAELDRRFRAEKDLKLAHIAARNTRPTVESEPVARREFIERIRDETRHFAGPEVQKGFVDACNAILALMVHERPAPPADAGLVELLTKAVGDIAAALTMAGKDALIQRWTGPYVEALNAHDEAAALIEARGEG
jgi:hypothetical protein